MALGEINPRVKPPKRGGGGLFGSIGAGLGLVAGALTGGLAAAPGAAIGGALAGAGAGATAGQIGGSLIGEAAIPSRGAKVTKKVSKIENAVKNDPNAQLAALQNAKVKLAETTEVPQPQAEEFLGLINNAQTKLQERLQIGRIG